jgi:hypothetical protein
MRLPRSEKLEIIRLVEQSHLPARRTLDMLGIRPSPTMSPTRAGQVAACFALDSILVWLVRTASNTGRWGRVNF